MRVSTRMVRPLPSFFVRVEVAPLALAIAAVALALSVSGCASDASDAKPPESAAGIGAAKIGRPAPDFAIPAVAGAEEKVGLRDLHGKVVLVDFWGTFCEPCKKSFPKLQELYSRYSSKGLRVVGISEDEAEDQAKIPGFVQAYGAKFTIGWDKSKTAARSYQPETMPSSFLVDRSGIIRYAHVGYHDGEDVTLEREIKELLAE
jgi:cytochrome c biogenesis protein CcmG, thiol:disulfide interchange protein DsbE